MKQHLIPGDAGSIEIAESIVPDSDLGAVLCHPHPQYGGSMDDGVLEAIDTGFHKAGISTLRFNFRGVGQSEGEYSSGAGEADDVATVVDWFMQDASLGGYFLGGYSFGAGIALRALSQSGMAPPRAMVLVAPPLQMISALSIVDVPILVILGSADQIVSAGDVSAYFSTYPRASLRLIEGADHFFFGRAGAITGSVEEFVRGI